MKKQMKHTIAALILLITLSVSGQEKNQTIEVSGTSISAKLLTDGNVKFYKDVKNNTHYIENSRTQSGIIELKGLGNPNVNSTNRGKLLVIFGDCVSVRNKAQRSDITEIRIIQLIDDYNNCGEYTSSYELSGRDQKDQSYASQKTIINFDAGIGYYNETTDLTIDDNPEIDDNDSNFSIYASFNISPKHLKSLTGRLFFDFAIQYNFGTSVEFPTVSQDLSSLFITLTPKYYFNQPESTFNPFLGVGFGAAIIDYEIEDKTNAVFEGFDRTKTKFIYGIELGAEFLNNFEAALIYYPDFKTRDVIEDDISLRSKFKNLTFRLGYKF